MNRFALALLVVALTPAAAMATTQGNAAIVRWKAMDRCAQQAHAAYPDFTAEANAKRNKKLEDCLAGQTLPPRAPLAPQRQ